MTLGLRSEGIQNATTNDLVGCLLVQFKYIQPGKESKSQRGCDTGGRRKFIVLNEVKCGGRRGRNDGSRASGREQELDH